MKLLTRHLLRLLPLLLVILIIILVFYFKIDQYISFATIKTHKESLVSWINSHYALSVLLFMLTYILVISLSIPFAVYFTIAAGFLFGSLLGAFYDVICSTIGATGIFLIVQFSLGQWLAEKKGSWMTRMQHGFQENALQYLIFLRLVPVFPFAVVNIVAGLLNIRTFTFIIGTFIGVIPSSIVYALLGNGLGYAFATGKAPQLSIIFEPPVFWPLIGLATLAIIPIVFAHFRKKNPPKSL